MQTFQKTANSLNEIRQKKTLNAIWTEHQQGDYARYQKIFISTRLKENQIQIQVFFKN